MNKWFIFFINIISVQVNQSALLNVLKIKVNSKNDSIVIWIYTETESMCSFVLIVDVSSMFANRVNVLFSCTAVGVRNQWNPARGQKGLSCVWWNVHWQPLWWSHSSFFLHNSFIKQKTIVPVVLQLACPGPDRLKEEGCSHAAKKQGVHRPEKGQTLPLCMLDGMREGKSKLQGGSR